MSQWPYPNSISQSPDEFPSMQPLRHSNICIAQHPNPACIPHPELPMHQPQPAHPLEFRVVPSQTRMPPVMQHEIGNSMPLTWLDPSLHQIVGYHNHPPTPSDPPFPATITPPLRGPRKAKTAHKENIPVQCQHCPKAFSSATIVKAHMRHDHPKEYKEEEEAKKRHRNDQRNANRAFKK